MQTGKCFSVYTSNSSKTSLWVTAAIFDLQGLGTVLLRSSPNPSLKSDELDEEMLLELLEDDESTNT